ncbi:TetR/AcrR family transcriptional regulator [Nocardioides sp. LS1]|uniref:TetR/AcrR family transcriptional regulator n=1 Tax=Nocardioides sp. LS1 TaxID=1027620 RepID=UPI000F617CB6|nr:TetR/AcrR family transcriptional regulator [Nocardioides sp. LS1]
MSTRDLILAKAAELLAASPSGDISTRAVCEAVGITQPALYRHFADKDTLLAGVVDHVWDQYLSMKRAAPQSDDPLTDLYIGWESHTAFALNNPHAYRLLFGTSLSTTPEAGAEALRILEEHLERLAEQGRLRISAAAAARLVMAANTGVALALILRPGDFPDVEISNSMRDELYRSLLVDALTTGSPQAVAATTLRAGLSKESDFSVGERALLDEWLGRVEQRHATDASTPTAEQDTP